MHAQTSLPNRLKICVEALGVNAMVILKKMGARGPPPAAAKERGKAASVR